MRKNIKENIWNFIDKNGPVVDIKLRKCWIWLGYKTNKGYGTMRVNMKTYLTHRLTYELTYGKIKRGNFICHKCDNPSCVRPSHLFSGTHKDNMQDMFKKGRHNNRKGENSNVSKLTERQVLEIRAKYKPKIYEMKKLAKEYNISFQNVSAIVNRKLWKHI